ncbi:MAG: hypothetical protein NWQ54_10870 [Paraglaciecola sp.]|nr:hypothetical protein [Paraglaciecola sp.]
MSGWIKLYRSIQDNDLWLAEPFSKGQAWADLILSANHKPGTFWVRQVQIRLERGQLGLSEITLSKRWKWSRGKVGRYLRMLENRRMIEQQKTPVTSIITICNYSNYQHEEPEKISKIEQQTEQLTVQVADNSRYTNKNDKNDKKKNIDHLIGDRHAQKWFETLWQHYAELTGGASKIGSKKAALKTWQSLTKGYNDDRLRYQVNVCLAFQEMRTADKTCFGANQHCVTYLNQEVWKSDSAWLQKFDEHYQQQLANEQSSEAENGSIN